MAWTDDGEVVRESLSHWSIPNDWKSFCVKEAENFPFWEDVFKLSTNICISRLEDHPIVKKKKSSLSEVWIVKADEDSEVFATSFFRQPRAVERIEYKAASVFLDKARQLGLDESIRNGAFAPRNIDISNLNGQFLPKNLQNCVTAYSIGDRFVSSCAKSFHRFGFEGTNGETIVRDYFCGDFFKLFGVGFSRMMVFLNVTFHVVVSRVTGFRKLASNAIENLKMVNFYI